MEALYKKVIEIFQKNPPPGHDYKHALRTAALAKKIAEAEGYDTAEAEVAGLLHDVGRTLQAEGKTHGPAGVPLAKELLDSHTNFSEETKDRILSAIHDHSNLKTEGELKHILQDADKLDGLGAIGISRAYISHHFLPDYDPQNIIPDPGIYNEATSIHQQIRFAMTWNEMFYTETAKKIGKTRYEFMENFLKQIKEEIAQSS
jgi:uncharacterized protein